VRALARELGHARLNAQIYAEAAVSPALAAIVERQLAVLRTAVADLVPGHRRVEAEAIAAAFVALCIGYSQELAVRGDLDSEPVVQGVLAIIKG
jgi:hypothetical protein